MSKRKTTALLSALACVGILAACDPVTSSSSSDSLASSSGSNPSSSSSWSQGENAIPGAEQPLNPNPSGSYGAIGNLKASQGEAPLVSVGSANIMVVPVQFKDSTAMTSTMANILYRAFFDGDNAFTTVKDFYATSSYGKLDIDGVITPIVTLDDDVFTTLQKVYSQGVSSVVDSIANEVYDYLFNETKTYNPANFDANKDGKIDSLFLTYGFAEGGVTFTDATYQTLANTLFTDNITIKSNSEINNISWMSGNAPLGTSRFVMEAGDILGLENYLDTTGDLYGNVRLPLGATDMMDVGVLDHNPFSKWLLDWINPDVITTADLENNVSVRLESAGSSENSVVVLATEETGVFGEYLMVDYYDPEDGNFALTSANYLETSGVRVYKIDSRLVRSNEAHNRYLPYNGEPDFNDGRIYDFAYSNNGIGDYSAYGIDNNFPLVGILAKNGSNRYFTSSSYRYIEEYMWSAGDTFVGDTGIDGFYSNYRFNGDGNNGAYLNMDFTVTSLDEVAALELRREN